MGSSHHLSIYKKQMLSHEMENVHKNLTLYGSLSPLQLSLVHISVLLWFGPLLPYLL